MPPPPQAPTAGERLRRVIDDQRTGLVMVSTGLFAVAGGPTRQIFWLVLLLIAAITVSIDGGPPPAADEPGDGGGGGGGGGLRRPSGPYPTRPAGRRT